MQNRNLLNLVLALALAGLLVLVLIDTDDPAQTPSIRLTQQAATDIQHIIIEGLDQPRIVLEKTADRWQLREPFTAPADTELVTRLLKLSSATSHSHYPLSSVDSAQLQLDEPQLRIRFDDTQLHFGTTDALNGYRYVQNNNTVHLITDRYSHSLRGDAAHFVSPRLLPAETRIEGLKLPDTTLRRGDNDWQLMGTEQMIDANRLQQWIDEWQHARALRVTRTNEHTETEVDKHIEIQLADRDAPLVFELQQTDIETILRRNDLGLNFHFTPDNAERLLSPPVASDQSSRVGGIAHQ
jgi:hypothetical protein